MHFDINRFQQYFLERAKHSAGNNQNETEIQEEFQELDTKTFNLKAIFSIFDKNYDGKISAEEFNSVSREEYNEYIGELQTYSQQRSLNGQFGDNNSIWTYGQMQGYLNDVIGDEGAYTICEDEAMFDSIGTEKIKPQEEIPQDRQAFYNARYNNADTFELKDISTMSEAEIIAELNEYGIDTANMNMNKLKSVLTNERKNRAISDNGSNEVDGRIGTYIQGDNKLCSVLSKLVNMSEEEIAELFVGNNNGVPEAKIDENGEKYWEIQFPQDKGTNITVKITENEIRSNLITFEENGESRTLGGVFPHGDDDVTLLTMAFVKRFGTSIMRAGAWALQTENKFSQNETYFDNQHLELMSDYSQLNGSMLGMLSLEELERKGIVFESLTDKDLSYLPERVRGLARLEKGEIIDLSDGRKACINKYGIFFDDGSCIQPGHAMPVIGYDAGNKQVIITGNEFNNLSQIAVPEELLVYFETASLENTAGVKETPQPELTD